MYRPQKREYHADMFASGLISQHVSTIDRSTIIDRFIDFRPELAVHSRNCGAMGDGQT